MNFVIDIDGTLTLEVDGHDYESRTPDKVAIGNICKLWEEGHHIILHSSRFSEDQGKTVRWLRENGVPFDRLVLGKPCASVYIDDRSLPAVDGQMLQYLDYKMSHSCWRFQHGTIASDEVHPCFFCGQGIPLGTLECKCCGIMVCPACGKCLCNVPLISKITMFMIYAQYCHYLPNFRGRIDPTELGRFVDMDVVKNAEKAIKFCAIKEGLFHEV